jgi:hypothetical protein
MTVKISVVDGVAYVDEVPAGVTVQVTDYDVDTRNTKERDEDGTPCSRYVVTSQTPKTTAAGLMALSGGVPRLAEVA